MKTNGATTQPLERCPRCANQMARIEGGESFCLVPSCIESARRARKPKPSKKLKRFALVEEIERFETEQAAQERMRFCAMERKFHVIEVKP